MVPQRTKYAAPVEWTENGHQLVCSNGQGIVFQDSIEHWREAFLRLLNFTEEQGRAWVERVAIEASCCGEEPFLERSPQARIAVLERAGGVSNESSFRISGLPVSVLGSPVDKIWFSALRNDTNFRVVGNQGLQHGILVTMQEGSWQPVRPIPYEENYFEGNQAGVGYGACNAQTGWRLEKAARTVRQIQGIAQFLGYRLESNVRLLDVGAGYGYLRKVATEAGWCNDGVEISRYAADEARRNFGLDTFVGTLEDLHRSAPGTQFDVLTLFDLVEHVEEPVALLKLAGEMLKPGGLCVIRTPNIEALEVGIFGNHYHSLKMEHLQYFSATSLCRVMELAGLRPAFFTSESHLLRGFLGSELDGYSSRLRGSDLFAVGQKPR
jgi:2-polyprenyl-3-methyl-5-hydroxy-6-metoxy-1,4-benzoquinol methylase